MDGIRTGHSTERTLGEHRCTYMYVTRLIAYILLAHVFWFEDGDKSVRVVLLRQTRDVERSGVEARLFKPKTKGLTQPGG